MADLKIRQVRSSNGASPSQRETLRSLKLGKIGRSSIHADNVQLQGMIRVVKHLVEVGGGEEVKQK